MKIERRELMILNYLLVEIMPLFKMENKKQFYFVRILFYL